jgi:single-strand DNA-binding protein
MAKSVNRTFLLGHVGKNPEVGTTPGGTLAVNFSLATTDREKDRQGNWSDRTEWHNLVAYGRTAEIVRDYVSKGTQLFIQGKIQTRSWDDKESGQKRYWTEIFVHDLTLLGGGRGENGGSTHSNGRDDSRRSSGGSGYQPQQMASERVIDLNPVCLTYFTFLDMVFDPGFGPRHLGFRLFKLALETATRSPDLRARSVDSRQF